MGATRQDADAPADPVTEPRAVAPRLPVWSIAVPPVAAALLVATWGREPAGVLLAVIAVGLVAAVVCAVHHAEVVAHKVGEPLGTLVLAVAVTVIEVGLIVALMVSSPTTTASLARDTVFAAIMIVTNGVVGLCLLVGALRHQVVTFRLDGVGGALATLAAVAALGLVLPSFTTSTPGPTYSGAQLAFAGVASLVLYAVFVVVQTVRHRDFFLPPRDVDVDTDHDGVPDAHDDDHAAAPTRRTAWAAMGLLLVCLVAVVGLAKTASKAVEHAVAAVGAPAAVVGVVIALVVLAPETVAAVRAAARNRVQTSLNLALGSALASIGLTIPVIALASVWLSGPLQLGLGPKELVLLALTLVVSTLTAVTGRATILQGAVHLVVFAAFVVLALTP